MMGKLLILTSCCFMIVASDLDTNNFLAFQEQPSPGHVEAVNDRHMQQLFERLLGKRSLRVGPEIGPFELKAPMNGIPEVPEVMHLHNQLQNKLGWGGDPPKQQFRPPPPRPNQNYGGPPPPPPNRQQYGPPPGPPNQQYGPPQAPPHQSQQYGPPPGPPSQQYGPPPGPPNQQYGPPQAPPSQQYGPPPGPPNQQYGPPQAPPSQQYGPPPAPPQQSQQYGPPQATPSQQYGPPPAPPQQSQQYGPPPATPSQQYGPPPAPPSQEYGTPNNDANKVKQGTFGGHIENFKLTDAVRNNDQPPSKSAPSSQYGPPSFADNSGYNNNGLDDDDSDNSKIFKHVYIHTPHEEQEEQLAPRVIRPNKKQDTHYQIIFVKAPNPPQQPPTEIELPSPPEKKTLVYVLVKKPEKPAEIKFRAPPPTQPAKPEVYFIRYKGNLKGKNGDRPEDLLSQISHKDIISSNSRPQRLNDLDDDGGYSLDSQKITKFRGGSSNEDDIPKVKSNLLSGRSKDRDSVGYPNAEYRAAPSMLNPNDEPMSFAVYDRVRNEKVPTNSASGGGLATSASDLDLIVRRSSRMKPLKQGRSHYTAPGSRPFHMPSGRMVRGEYVGMTATSLRNKYYSPLEEVK